MKKSLSLLVAAAMTISTASVAFADATAPATTDLTAQQKFDALKAQGVLSGFPDGSAGLDKEMTRAEFAKVLTKLAQLEENAKAAKIYTDVPATHWAAGFIGASTEAKLLNGLGANKFGPSGKVTVEQIAKVADLFAGVEPLKDATVAGKTSAWATGYVAAAIKAGLLPELPTYTTNATRGQLVEVAYDLASAVVKVASTKVVDATHIEVTFSDGGVAKKELTTALVNGVATKVTVEYQGKSYEVEVKLEAVAATSASQTGAKKVTVKFNQAVSATDKAALTYELKSGLTTFPVTAKFADDNMSAVLSAAYLPAGDFKLTVKGSEAISLKIEAEAAKKVDITATTLQLADGQDLGVKVFNQFGEAMNTAAQITSFNVTKGKALVGTTSLDLLTGANAAVATSLNDVISVTAIYPAAGLSVNKQLKVINGSVATSIKLGTVQPLTGDTRVSVGKTGYVLPLTMVDANGQAVTLPKTTAVNKINFATNIVNYAGLTFYVSDTSIIKDFWVDANGVVTFDTVKNAANNASGTVYITVTNGATGASATTSVVVNDLPAVKTLSLSNPSSVVVQNEPVVLPFTATDSYDAAIAPKDLSLNTPGHVVTFTAFGKPATVVKNAKGELVFTPDTAGSTTLYVYVNGIPQANSISLNVQDPKFYTAVNGTHDVATTYEVGASNTFDASKITLVDNYGRVTDLTGGVTITSDSPGVVTTTGGKLTAVGTGSATITVKSNLPVDATHNSNKAITDLTFTVNVVASSDIKTYAIDTIGTLYGNIDSTKVIAATDGHQKAVTLVGKTASGTTVALKSNIPTFVTSTDESVLKLEASGKSVYGVKAGKSTVAAYFNGTKVAEQEVTVSEDAPIVKSVSFDADEYTGTIVAPATTVNVPVTATVKDQYGVKIAAPFQIISGDSTVATVAAANSLNVTGIKKGQSTTLTYVTSNGTTDTAVIVIN